jgi:hypothetical protein
MTFSLEDDSPAFRLPGDRTEEAKPALHVKKPDCGFRKGRFQMSEKLTHADKALGKAIKTQAWDLVLILLYQWNKNQNNFKRRLRCIR